MLSIKVVRKTEAEAKNVRAAIIESLGGEELLPLLKNFTITDIKPSNNDDESYIFFIILAKNNPIISTFIKVPADVDIDWVNETKVIEDKDGDKFII